MVVSGILVSTLLTLFLLPGVMQLLLRGQKRHEEDEEPVSEAAPTPSPAE